MAPWGGRRKIVGNNPWSWACPAGRHTAMVLDIANTGVARGKVYLARQRGETIPEGWAINAAGEPTTDPQEAIDGMILPSGRPQGICNLRHHGHALRRPHRQQKSATRSAWAIPSCRQEQCRPSDDRSGHRRLPTDRTFPSAHRGATAALKSSSLAKDAEEIFYPGEIEARNDAVHRRDGILLPEDTLEDLKKIAIEYALTNLPAALS